MKSTRIIFILYAAILFAAGTFHGFGQDITPVDVDPGKPEEPRLHYYDRHGNKLGKPVYFLAEKDTVKKSGPKSPYPLFNGVTVGVNFFDAAMLLAGQSYASFDASLSVSVANWIFPTVEAGIGYAHNTRDESTMVYSTKPSPYAKIGFDYNFLYKSSPAYMAGIGVRFGWAKPEYEITGASVSSPYWNQTADFEILNQKTTAWYGEALAAVKVKIWKSLSMGWSVRYRFKLKIPDASNSTPWFIPGYGGSSPLRATFSLMFTFGSPKPKPAVTPPEEDGE